MRTMVKAVVMVLAFTFLYCLDVPTAEAAPFFGPYFGAADFADPNADPYSPLTKRGNAGVDAWSICPPHMADVDCFYAYLRVYARLRKAAEESDRVSMRNIGKRSSAMTSVAEFPRNRRRMKLEDLCPEELLPTECYLALRTLYHRLQTSILNVE